MFCTDISTLDINDVKSAVCSEPDSPAAVVDQMRGESESLGNLSWPSMKVEWNCCKANCLSWLARQVMVGGGSLDEQTPHSLLLLCYSYSYSAHRYWLHHYIVIVRVLKIIETKTMGTTIKIF